MLQVQTLPASLAGLLFAFRWCFTEASYRTFVALLGGMVAQPARRTVCGMLVGAGLAPVWHHSRAHWFWASPRNVETSPKWESDGDGGDQTQVRAGVP